MAKFTFHDHKDKRFANYCSRKLIAVSHASHNGALQAVYSIAVARAIILSQLAQYPEPRKPQHIVWATTWNRYLDILKEIEHGKAT